MAMTQARQPKYQQIAGDLRARIQAGEFPPDTLLPTHAVLMEHYDSALNTIRDALDELRKQGMAETFQGIGTYVRTPSPPPASSPLPEGVAEEIGGLRDEVHDLAGQVESLKSADVRAALERLELNLIELYGKLGYDYPREDTAEDDDSSSEAAAHGNRA